MTNNQRKSFTLIELLVVLALVAILSVVVILTLNPAELIKQARDSNRLSDLATINTALNLFSADVTGGFMGTSTVVYVSIPDTSPTCANLDLPILPTSTIAWTYNCVTATSTRNTNGTGWIPVNFQRISSNSPISQLPIDPINTTSTRLYYTYVAGGSWELSASIEASKNKLGGSNDLVSKDGGGSMSQYETGNNLNLNPIETGDSSLVGYWNFEETSGSVVGDGSGYGNKGALVSAQFSGMNCKIGNCLYMNNVVGVNFATTTSIRTMLSGGKFTYSAWVYTTSSVGNVDLMGFQGYSPYWGYTLQVQTISALYYLRSQDIGGSWTNFSVSLPAVMTASAWHFVTITHDAETGVAVAYLDGIRGGVGLAQYTGSVNSIFRFGVQGWSGFSGYIDEARIYNRALSAAEVLAIYNATK